MYFALLLCTHCGAVEKRFDGVEIKVLATLAMYRPLETQYKQWEAQTGAKVSFTISPSFAQSLDEIRAEGETGIGHDVYLMTSTAMPELASKGYVKDITDRVKQDVQLDWTDIFSFVRKNNVGFNHRVWGLPFDSDSMLLVYRSDLMSTPPLTVEELVDEAIRLNGQDLNGDGIPDSGWCGCWGPSADGTVYYIMGDQLMNVVTPYLQSKGSSEGAFFDTTTMRAKTHTAAWKKAFSLLVRLYKEGTDPKANRCDGRDAPNRFRHAGSKFQNGTCAFYSYWTSAQMTRANAEQSFVLPYIQHAVFPGSHEVNQDDNLVECTLETCPYAVHRDAKGRLVNQAPFAAYGGFIGTVAGHSRNADAAFAFLSYCNRAENSASLVVEFPGLEPWRTSQLLPQLWESQLPASLVKSFLSTTRQILNHDNVVIDLRIPGAADYITEAGKMLSKVLLGEIAEHDAPEVLAQAWDRIIEKHGGREELLPLYRNSLSLREKTETAVLSVTEDGVEGWQVVVIVLVVLLFVVVVGLQVFRMKMSSQGNNAHISKCADAIATLRFDQVSFLDTLTRPTKEELSLRDIVQSVREYKEFLPQALYANAATKGVSDTSETESGDQRGVGAAHIENVSRQLGMPPAKKKVSLLAVHYQADATKCSENEMLSVSSLILDGISGVTDNGRNGVALCGSGDYTMVAMNAAVGCVGHEAKCCMSALSLRSMLSSMIPDYHETIGLSATTGTATILISGTKTIKNFAVLGEITLRARTQASLCLSFPAPVLFVDSSIEDASKEQTVSEPFAIAPASFLRTGHRQIIYNVQKSKEHSGDSWMYELTPSTQPIELFSLLEEGGAANIDSLKKITAAYAERKPQKLYDACITKLRERFETAN